MRSCLICPSNRHAVAALTQTMPLSNLPLIGKSLLEHWLEHLAGIGATDARILTSDRPEMVRKLVGDGARWGLKVDVIVEAEELTPAAARSKYGGCETEWLSEPNDIVLMTHFPFSPEQPLFTSYGALFSALLERMEGSASLNRIGVRELRPGVWTAMRTRISPTARLRAPCWIGEGVTIGARSIIGPMAIIEDHALIESDCEITGSLVGPDTLLGKLTELRDSLAWGGMLVNWKTGSFAQVPDPYLMCALDRPPFPPRNTGWLQQLAALFGPKQEEFPGALDESEAAGAVKIALEVKTSRVSDIKGVSRNKL